MVRAGNANEGHRHDEVVDGMMADGHHAHPRHLDDEIHSQPSPAEVDVSIVTGGGIDHGVYNANVEDNDADMSTDEENSVEVNGDGGGCDDDDKR